MAKKDKQYAVIGLGRFGSSVAKTLYEMGHDVLAVDENMDLVEDIANQVTHAVQADALDEQALRALGLRNFDAAIVAIGENTQASILITLLLKELGVERVITKAQTELHAKVLRRIGADKVIFPERDMGERLARNLSSSNILDFIELSAEYSIAEIAVIPDWEGKTLKELDFRIRYGINVMAIHKEGGTMNVAPHGGDRVDRTDVLVVIGAQEDISRLA